MKKLSIILLIGISCALMLYVVLLLIADKSACTKFGKKRIALFTPATHPALEEIEQGFKETLQKLHSDSFIFTSFNANGNRSLLRAQAEEILSHDYDLIFTIGATCSQTIVELIKKKRIKTPHVFGAVDSSDFAQSLTTSGSSTGVYIQLNYKQEMDVLHKLKPMAKNILLVYDPTHGTGLEKCKKEIEEYIKKYGMKLHSVEIYQTNEIQQKVAALLPSIDVVLVLVDNTVVAGIDALITLCNRYGITLMASDLASGKKGAALAYGVTEYESGSGAAHKAYEILMYDQKPSKLSISAITNFRVAVNKDTIKLQNLVIENDIIEAFETYE